MNDSTKTNERRDQEAEDQALTVPEGDKVFLLVDGQKSGPFSKEQVTEMVASRDVLITDHVSVDGHEWFHLYQWSDFDRRVAHKEELPGLPQVNLFVASDKEVDESLENRKEDLIEREAMAGLAYLGNLNSGKRAQYHNDKVNEKAKADPAAIVDPVEELNGPVFEKQSTRKDTFIWGAAFCFIVAAIAWISLKPTDSSKVAKTKTKVEKVQKAKIGKATKSRSVAAKARTPKPRKVVKARKKAPSFTKSKAFRNRAPRRKPASKPKRIEKPVVEDPDDYYYDDGTDPVELDPIRSKVAKETFDPDSEEFDEYLDEVDPDREPASEFGDEDPEKAFEALYE